MLDDEPIYAESLHPNDRLRLELITQPRVWDYPKFREVMISLGILGNGAAVPAINRPDSVHMGGFRPYVDRLLKATRQKGVEYAQAVLVDKEEKGLVMGKITSGTKEQVVVDPMNAPGREGKQVLVGSIHIHPGWETSHGLSPQDYKTFLGDKREQMMLMAYGEGLLLMVLKTSVTPNNLKPEAVTAQLSVIEAEFLKRGNGPDLLRVVNFNKQVCLEYGLSLFTNRPESRDLLGRVNVAVRAAKAGEK